MAIADVIAAKVDTIREAGALDGDRFSSDQLVQDATLFNFVQAAQAAADPGAHVIADAEWPTPRTMGETFAILERWGRCPRISPRSSR